MNQLDQFDQMFSSARNVAQSQSPVCGLKTSKFTDHMNDMNYPHHHNDHHHCHLIFPKVPSPHSVSMRGHHPASRYTNGRPQHLVVHHGDGGGDVTGMDAIVTSVNTILTVPRPPQSSLLMMSSSKSSKLGTNAISFWKSGLGIMSSSIGSKAMMRSMSMRKAPGVLQYSPETCDSCGHDVFQQSRPCLYT